jgi:hypothetical protein
MCRIPYSFSVFIHLSAIIPVMGGIKIEAIASVEKIAPNCAPVQPFALKQYVPIVISQAPQTKNWRKLMRVKRNLIFMLKDLISI